MIRDESKEHISMKIALCQQGISFSFPACQKSAGAQLIYTVTDFIRCSYLTHQKLQIFAFVISKDLLYSRTFLICLHFTFEIKITVVVFQCICISYST